MRRVCTVDSRAGDHRSEVINRAVLSVWLLRYPVPSSLGPTARVELPLCPPKVALRPTRRIGAWVHACRSDGARGVLCKRGSITGTRRERRRSAAHSWEMAIMAPSPASILLGRSKAQLTLSRDRIRVGTHQAQGPI